MYEIEKQDGANGGRYVIFLDNGDEAEMTYRRRDENTIIIDHTMVPPAYRGKGIAEELVNRGIADARADGHKIVPLCSYVATQFRRHPEWTDLLAQ